VPTETTPSLAERRFSWGWIVAAVPGVLALAIVLFIAWKWRDRMPWQRGNPSFRTMADLERRNPKDLRRFIRANEPALRQRLIAEIRREARTGRPGRAETLRQTVERIVFPHLDEKQVSEWRDELDRAIPPRRGLGTGVRNGTEDPVIVDLMKGSLFRLLNERPEKADPDRAQNEFKAAQAAARQLGRNEVTSPGVRLRAFGRAIDGHVKAIHHHPTNWEYRWEFALFLQDWTGIRRGGAIRGRELLELAADQMSLAKDLCPDRAKKNEIERTERILRKRLESLPGGPATFPRGGLRGGGPFRRGGDRPGPTSGRPERFRPTPERSPAP
jgi:hypothetical protein